MSISGGSLNQSILVTETSTGDGNAIMINGTFSDRGSFIRLTDRAGTRDIQLLSRGTRFVTLTAIDVPGIGIVSEVDEWVRLGGANRSSGAGFLADEVEPNGFEVGLGVGLLATEVVGIVD